MVGSSSWTNDSNVEAPIRSPAAAKIVLPAGASARSSSTAVANGAAPAALPPSGSSRPWKSLVLRTWIFFGVTGVNVRQVEAHDLGVVVRGRERVVRVEEDRRVVVVAAVLVGHRLVGVDLPDVGAGHHVHGRGVAEHVVERAGQAAEGVALLVRVVGRLDQLEAAGLEDVDRLLLGVGVEVTGEEDRLDVARRGEVVGELHEAVGLAHPVAVEGADERVVGVVAARIGRLRALRVVQLSPFDLKWLTMTANASLLGAPAALNAWASGSRALANWVVPNRMSDWPTGVTSAGW